MSRACPTSLRVASPVRCAASMVRAPAPRFFVAQVFNDSISSSLFTSPSMQRFKRQTDSMFADLSSSFQRFSSLSVVQDVRSSLFAWFR